MFVNHQLGYIPRFGEPWTADAVLSFLKPIALKIGDATNSFYIPKDRTSELYIDIQADKYAWSQSLLDQANIRYQLPPGVGAAEPTVNSTAVPVQPSSALPAGMALPEPGTLPGQSTTINTTMYPLATSLPPVEQPSLSSVALLMGLAGLGFLILLPSGRRAAVRYRTRRVRRGRK